MNKEQVKEIITTSIQQNIITRDEVISVATTSAASRQGGVKVETSNEKESSVPKVLYSIGGVIAITGILVLLGNNWDNIGFIGRWLVTVGLGLATFIGALIVYKNSEYNILSQVLFAIASIASFIGGFVWLENSRDSLYWYWDGPNSILLVSSILFVIFTTALYVSKKSILHVIAPIFFTIAYYALIAKLLKGSGFGLVALKDIVVYSSMIIAIGYFMYNSWIYKGTFTQSLPMGTKKTLGGVFTFASFGLFLMSGLFLGGIWNLIYAFIVIGAVVLSVKLKTKIGLLISAIAIGIYCIKISVEYFADSISFSVALLASGLLIIALGYLTYYLNKKYITGKTS